jgi:arsenate reductase
MSLPPLTLYGIPNCDSVKKARAWLNDQAWSHEFHDFKKQGLSEALIDQWLALVPWETLLNTRGTTWRQLSEAERAQGTTAAGARALLLAHPSLVKRPVLHNLSTNTLVVGVKPEEWLAWRSA